MQCMAPSLLAAADHIEFTAGGEGQLELGAPEGAACRGH